MYDAFAKLGWKVTKGKGGIDEVYDAENNRIGDWWTWEENFFGRVFYSSPLLANVPKGYAETIGMVRKRIREVLEGEGLETVITYSRGVTSVKIRIEEKDLTEDHLRRTLLWYRRLEKLGDRLIDAVVKKDKRTNFNIRDYIIKETADTKEEH